MTKGPAGANRTARALGRLGTAINEFDRHVAQFSDAMTWEQAALLLRRAREQRDFLNDAIGAIEARVIVGRREEGAFGDIPVEGVGVVSIHRPKNRKAWDHDALAGHVLDAHLLRLEGDIPDPWTVREWLMGAAHIDYWRVGELADLGIDVDEFCTSTPGRPTVTIIHSNAPAAELA